MSVISTIDCTLRDGGYVNNWEFSNEFRIELLRALINAHVEIIECGFISSVSGSDAGGTHFKSVEKVNELIKENSFNISNSKFAVMMRLDEYDPDTLPACDKAQNCVNIIRVMVYKEEIPSGVQVIKKIIDKGYEVHIQPTIISHYSDEEIVNMLNAFRLVNYKSIAITDTFGALNDTDIKRITLLFDKYANKEAQLTLHCHNNLSNAYHNALAFFSSVNKNRDVCVDSSVNGIGRGAGNLSTEILLTTLKTEKNKNYLISPLKNFCDKYMGNFNGIVNKDNFYAYVITARKNMHPNYAAYLLLNSYKKHDLYKILELISPEKYETFDFEYIKSLCEIYLLKV